MFRDNTLIRWFVDQIISSGHLRGCQLFQLLWSQVQELVIAERCHGVFSLVECAHYAATILCPQNNFKTVRNNSFLGPFALSLITKGPEDVRLVALGSLSPPLSGGFFDSSTKRSFSVVNVLSAKFDAFPCSTRNPQSPTADTSSASTASTPAHCHPRLPPSSSSAYPARFRHWRAR